MCGACLERWAPLVDFRYDDPLENDDNPLPAGPAEVMSGKTLAEALAVDDEDH